MLRMPIKYTVSQIKNEGILKLKNGKWIPARPNGYYSFLLFYRIKVCFDVFTGKADALYWEE